MTRAARLAAVAVGLVSALAAGSAFAQKPGGMLKMYFFDSPASMSIHEEATIAGQGPMAGVFNNLVMYDQHVPQASLKSVVPDLATEWAWSEDGKDLTFKLRPGVKWHDGKPFSANDVKCSWELLLGTAKEKLRINARETWWTNLSEVTADSERQATFHLKRPQPSFPA